MLHAEPATLLIEQPSIQCRDFGLDASDNGLRRAGAVVGIHCTRQRSRRNGFGTGESKRWDR
jgi:hypothetical protein